jgi:very-short-patch-repair endonuclease
MKLGEMKELFSTFIKHPESIVKSKATSIEKYGKDHYFKTLECKLGMRKKAFFRFYKNWEDYQLKLLKNEQVKCLSDEKVICNDLPLNFECILCNHKWVSDYLLMPECPKCKEGFKNSRSKEEAALLIWLSNVITEKIPPNKRFIINGKTYEADVVIEDKKVIIELHGLWWHSENHGNKDRNYHIDKYNALKSLGYDIFQIFEDEWMLKSDIIKRKLLHKLTRCGNPYPFRVGDEQRTSFL